MSIEEQDQILGRLTREERESRRRLAALDAFIVDLRKQLNDAAGRFGGFLTENGAEKIRAAIESVDGLPDKETILKALRDLQQERENHERIAEQLRKFSD